MYGERPHVLADEVARLGADVRCGAYGLVSWGTTERALRLIAVSIKLSLVLHNT